MRPTRRANWVPLAVAFALGSIAVSCGGGGGGGSSTPPPPAVSVTVAPSTATVNLSLTQQFTATVNNASNTAVTWSISPTTAGSVSSSGLYTAPDDLPSSATVTVTATSQQDTSKSASATVTIASNEAVSVSPAAVNLKAGQQQQFSASLTGSSKDQTVTWSAVSGTITSSGLYTAPANGTDTVTATSKADPSKKGSATVTVVVVVAVSPASASVNLSSPQQFTATVTGTSNTAVTWSLTGPGTLDQHGNYAAPDDLPANTSVTVTATSAADTTKSASATVTIASNESVSVSPSSATLTVGQQQQFTVSVTGSSKDQAVSWSAVSGTITSSGLYTAPASGTDTVTATSKADPSKQGSATVAVAVPVSVSPASAVVGGLGTVQFAATAGGATVAVTWSAVSGSITANGLYTAPASGTDTVTATSVSDKTNKASASVTIDAKSASTLLTLGPIVAMQEGPAFTLTLNGNGFSKGNTVLFNGKPETTTFVGATQLTASVSSGDIALPGVNAPLPALQVAVETGSTVTAPLSFYVVPSVSPKTVTVTGGASESSVNVNLSPLMPTLSLEFVGTCNGANCSASQAGTSVSLAQAIANGGQVQMYLVGTGLVPGTFFVFKGDSGDITVTQPVVSDFITNANPTAVSFNITVSANTKQGARSITVMNPGGEISVFPGGLLITQ